MNNNVFTMIPGQNSLPLGKTEQNKFWSQKCVICDSFVTRHTKKSTLFISYWFHPLLNITPINNILYHCSFHIYKLFELYYGV